MSSSRAIIFITFALVATVIVGAPLDEPAGQDSKSASSTTVAPSSTTVASDSSSSTTTSPSTTTPASPTSTGSPDVTAYTNTSFTCYGRSLGYYADIAQNCRVYHFCLLGEYNGEPIYQRVSYLCMNDKVFDQQALDCVKESEMKAPCKESHSYHDISNEVLRQAVLGSLASNGTDAAQKSISANATATTNTTTSTPATNV